MPIVAATSLAKTFRVADKQPGVRGTVKHFLKRKHRDVHAVRSIDFAIEPGEVVGFLGPNGAGKTTTLKMLTGLIKPSSGTARVLGDDPFRRRHALLKQLTLVMGNKQQLIWDLPTLDSLRINAAIYDIPDAEAKRRTAELAEMLTLGNELTQPVRKLSLGQRMKCELLAALLHHPRVLFLDEPTLGLDINAQAAVRAFLRTYNQQHGAAILLTSHYMADITALCERVVVIHQGELKYDGTLAGVVDRFAPFRLVKLAFDQDVPGDTLRRYGNIESAEGRAASLLVPSETVTDTLTHLLAELPIVDLSVTDPPIEDVIGRLFNDTGTQPHAAPEPTKGAGIP